MTNTSPYVDRNEASSILKVSTRTIDRYIRKHKFKTRKKGRRVLIKRRDVETIIKLHIGKVIDINAESLNRLLGKETSSNGERVTGLIIKDVKVKNPVNAEDRVYKDLYTEVKTDLKERQERLEAATYRVGQLESQVKNMVPMLEYNKTEKSLQEAQSTMDQRAQQNEELIAKMEAKIKSERLAKVVYLSLVGLLLVAEPILFMLWAFA